MDPSSVMEGLGEGASNITAIILPDKKICFPCKAFAECMRKTVVPIIVLTWINLIICAIAAFSPYWSTTGDGWNDGPLIRCSDGNGTLRDIECNFKDLAEQEDNLLEGASFTILFAVIGLFACAILGSLLNCACFEASRVCFIGVIIVTTIVSGILCLCCIVLYSIGSGDIFIPGSDDPPIYGWGFYMAVVEIIVVIPSAIIYTVFCACCGVCWTCQGALCCCC